MADTRAMSDSETGPAARDGAEHGHGAGHENEHAPTEPLGPVDVTTWAYALAGSGLGLLVIGALYLARGA